MTVDRPTVLRLLEIQGVEFNYDIERVVGESFEQGKPQRIPEDTGGGVEYKLTLDDETDVTVIVGDNGFVVTAYPGA